MNFLSQRGGFEEGENLLTKKLQKLKSEGRSILDLTISNPTKCEFEYPKKEILNLFQNDQIFTYNPDPKGLKSARESIVKYYVKNRDIKISPEDLFLTTGTSESFSFLLKLLCDPNEEILIPLPGYPLFESIAKLDCVYTRYYNLIYQINGEKKLWKINFGSLKESINSRTKLIVIIQPNNPTGSILSKEDFFKIIQIAEEKKIAIIVDEVFSEYLGVHQTINWMNSEQIPIFTLNGFSKMFGFPQFKLGWIHVNCPETLKKKIMNSLEMISDTYLSVNSLSQICSIDLFQTGNFMAKQINDRVIQNETLIYKLCKGSQKIKIFFREGGWSLILEIKTNLTDEEICLILLNEFSIYVFPGYFFDLESLNCIVISLIVPTEILLIGMNRILEFLKD